MGCMREATWLELRIYISGLTQTYTALGYTLLVAYYILLIAYSVIRGVRQPFYA